MGDGGWVALEPRGLWPRVVSPQLPAPYGRCWSSSTRAARSATVGPDGTRGSGPNPSAMNGKFDGVDGIGPATVGVGTAKRLVRWGPREAHPATPKHAHDTTRHRRRSRRRPTSGIADTTRS